MIPHSLSHKMKAKQRISRKTNPVIFVFCEGKTEEQYVKLLRVHFRVTIKIISKVVGTKITPRLINAHLTEYGYTPQDSIFYLYDGDREDIGRTLKNISQGIVLLSTPCIELWFLLHYGSYKRESKSEDVVKELNRSCPDYTKGVISENLKNTLKERWTIATERAIKLPEGTNPSTSVYKFIQHLNELTI